VGDAVNADGGGLAGGAGLPGEAGYWLHAQRLAFAHPAEGRTVRLECVPPAPLRG
jgi:23S rRNA pseudouridine1911/1915/1917 synthase